MELGDLLMGRRIRQNHALEHATVSILSAHTPGLAVSARANYHGFTIFADLDLDSVRRASAEALARLRAGERELAIHPNCGTNLAVGTSVMLAGWLFALRRLGGDWIGRGLRIGAPIGKRGTAPYHDTP